MTYIVGFLGPSGSGKSTAAQYLAQTYGARRYSIAGAIKAMASELWPAYPPEAWHGTQADKQKEYRGVSGRERMQILGDVLARALGPDALVQNVLNRIAVDSPRVAVIDDIRRVCEAKSVRDAGGYVIQVYNITDPPPVRDHTTEIEWAFAPHDATVVNHFGSDHFTSALDRLLSHIRDGSSR